MKKDKEVKTLQNGGKQELQSCTYSEILLVTSEVPWEAVLRDLVFFSFFSDGLSIAVSVWWSKHSGLSVVV